MTRKRAAINFAFTIDHERLLTAYRLSLPRSIPPTPSRHGTLTVPRPARPPARTRTSTSSPSPCTPIPSPVRRTSSSSRSAGMPMAPPISLTIATSVPRRWNSTRRRRRGSVSSRSTPSSAMTTGRMAGPRAVSPPPNSNTTGMFRSPLDKLYYRTATDFLSAVLVSATSYSGTSFSPTTRPACTPA